jgi:LysM repeat protein
MKRLSVLRLSILLFLLLIFSAACNLTGKTVDGEPIVTLPPPSATVLLPSQTPNPTATNRPAPTQTLIPNCLPNTAWQFTYVVQAGDTLGNIATRGNTSVSALMQGNCLANPDSLFAGQVLRVPQPISVPPDITVPAFRTYSNAALGIALDYPSGWSFQESGNLVTFQANNSVLEIMYGNVGEIIPVEQAVADCKAAMLCLGNREVLNEQTITLPSGFSGIRVAFSGDLVDGDPGPSLSFFVVMSNRNFYIRGFGDLSTFDPVINSFRPLMF